MSRALVSIIVPCYNYGSFIGETIESLQAQTYTNWECIVVDDGSTDNSKDVVSTYSKNDPRIKYFFQQNQGLSSARNTGISNASGSYIQFLDSDDLLAFDKLRLQLAVFESATEEEPIDIVYSGLRYFKDKHPKKLLHSSSGINHPWTLTKSGNGKDLMKFFIVSSPILVPMPLFRASAIKKVGYFKTELKSCEDWDYWFRCTEQDLRFQYLEHIDAISKVRLHPGSMTKNRKVMLPNMLAVRRKIGIVVKDIPYLSKLNNYFTAIDKHEYRFYLQSQNLPSLEIFKRVKIEKTYISLIPVSLIYKLPGTKWKFKTLSLFRSIFKKYIYNLG